MRSNRTHRLPTRRTALSASATTQHIYLDKQHPAVWRALNGLGLKVREAADAAGIDRRTLEVINVR